MDKIWTIFMQYWNNVLTLFWQYLDNIWRKFGWYLDNFAPILSKYCANISQILSRYCLNIVPNNVWVFSYKPINMTKILSKKCLNIIKIMSRMFIILSWAISIHWSNIVKNICQIVSKCHPNMVKYWANINYIWSRLYTKQCLNIF